MSDEINETPCPEITPSPAQAFVSGMLADPSNAALVAVFRDWLSENGEDGAAALVERFDELVMAAVERRMTVLEPHNGIAASNPSAWDAFIGDILRRNLIMSAYTRHRYISDGSGNDISRKVVEGWTITVTFGVITLSSINLDMY